MKKLIAVLVCLSLLSLVSCETIPQGLEKHKGAAGGAAIGAAGGAIIGGVAGGTRGAIIGGLLGALAGGAVGHYAYDQKRNQAQTNEIYKYDNPRASVREESVSVTPIRPRRGDRVNLDYSYAVLTTSQNPISLREIREITYGNTVWSSPEVQVERVGGTYRSSVPIFIPNDAKLGTYRVRFIIETGTTRDVRESSFTLR
jgi:outer membrane lipoprotein SlyB